MDDDNIHRRKISRIHEIYRNKRLTIFLGFLKRLFAHRLFCLEEVLPYHMYISDHFQRIAAQTGAYDVNKHGQCFGEYVGWIEIMPEVLFDHEFEDARYAAFAINLKNIYENQTYSFNEPIKIRDHLFLPEGFKNIVNVCDGINYQFMDVGRVVEKGDLPFMRMMVKYGVIRPKFQDSSIFILEDYVLWLREVDQLPLLSEQWHHIVDTVKEAAYRLLACNKEIDRESEIKLLRLQTVAIVFNVFNKCDPQSRNLVVESNDDIAECVRLYFEAVPEPFVSHLEIDHLLESVFEIKEYSVSRRIESFNKYRNIFPDMSAAKPRTLKHLSCCTLRENLCKRGPLPQVISNLPVPQSIKDYIQIV